MFGSGLWRRFAVLALFTLLSGAQGVLAKGLTPRELTRVAADQIMANKLEPDLYGPSLFKKLSTDLNSAGPLKELLALGAALKVNEADSETLPGGHVYLMVIKHERGLSLWTLGVNSHTKQIEYLTFEAGGKKAPGAPQAAAKPAPPAPAAGAAPTPPPAAGGSTACQKFPDLC